MRRITVLLPALLVATVALAFTVGDLETRADDLHLVYLDLEARVENCPGGACAERGQIEADHASAQSDLTQLHADRETLDPCSTCQPLDATLDDIDAVDVAVAGEITEWDHN